MEKGMERFFPFWGELTEGERQSLAGGGIAKKYKKGENIHGGAVQCTGVICVKSGRLRVYLLSEEGKEVTLFRLLENDVCILSASCMVKNIVFDVHVDADGDTEVFLISPDVYERVSAANRQVGEYLQEIIQMRFSEAVWVIEQILFTKLDKRLAAFLIDQAALEGGSSISLTHKEIADHMATAREVISRMLKYFEGEGLVAISRRGTDILDEKNLMKKAGLI